MTKINSKWTAGVENPEEIEKKMLEQKELFKRWYEIITQKQKANDSDQLKKGNYEIPNWELRQADYVGYNRCLEEFKALLNYTQE